MTWRIDLPGAERIFWREVAVRVLIIVVFIITENLSPFHRVIQPEEVWLYKYPNTEGYVSSLQLYIFIVCSCSAVVGFFLFLNRDLREAWEALLVASFAIPLGGLLTNVVKLSVGRPRPDYFARCYPGQDVFDITSPCTGDPDKIEEGRKSFPSGHSSNSFSSMMFITLYLAGKLGTFNSRGRAEGWRFIVTLFPLVLALAVAISRTCDYHHHWQDITVGSIIGALISYVVYRQHYPPSTSEYSEVPYILLQSSEINPSNSSQAHRNSGSTLAPLVKNV